MNGEFGGDNFVIDSLVFYCEVVQLIDDDKVRPLNYGSILRTQSIFSLNLLHHTGYPLGWYVLNNFAWKDDVEHFLTFVSM